MSNSALSSAKRRRTVGANDSPINSTSQVQESMQNNRPVSLQQAIHILNNRTLLLEQTVSESLGKNTENVYIYDEYESFRRRQNPRNGK